MNSAFFVSNRKRLAESMKDSSILVLYSGKAPHSSRDMEYPYTPNRTFFYFTGIDRENAILRITKKDGQVDETLFIEAPNELAAKWIGERMKVEEAKQASGISSIQFVEDFSIKSLFQRTSYEVLYLNFESEAWDTPNSPAHQLAGEVRTRLPHLSIENIFPVVCKLRAVKSEEEIAELKRAIEITDAGIRNMWAHTKPGLREYELEAHFDYTLRASGVREHAFPPIVAAGKRATVLHYVNNDKTVEDGNLVLIDLGASWNNYSADISRTFPANGKFSERQREIYEIVLLAEQETIAAVKPGITLKELNDVTKEVLARELKRIGKIQNDDQLADYYYHGVSHSLGLDTHDVWDNTYRLEPGHVITIEPGLYIAEESIGIRIEDDVVVTESGCEVLSPQIPRTVEEVEALIQGR